MAYDFPASPILNQTFNNYVWDGEKWKLQSPPVTGAVRYDIAQSLNSTQRSQARANVDVTKKNYIINGAMMVSQENGATSSGAIAWWPADMFGFFCNYGGGHQVQQVASVTPAGSPNRIRLTITTADAAVGATDYIQIIHTIEGFRMADLRAGTAAAKTVTLQFGVKAPAGTWSIAFKNGAADRYYIAEYVISAGEANTDVMKSVTLTLDQTGTWAKDNTAGMMISWNWMFGANYQGTSAGSWLAGNGYALASHSNLAATVGNIAEIFDVSLTEGSVAPPFTVPDYASELAACMRYWEAVGMTVLPAGGSPTSWYKVIKRSDPTITPIGTTGGAALFGIANTPRAGVRQGSPSSGASDITITANARL